MEKALKSAKVFTAGMRGISLPRLSACFAPRSVCEEIHNSEPPWQASQPTPSLSWKRSPRADSGISLDEAVNRAERKYRARVIRAETRESNGRRVHQLRLLSDDGRVWTVRIDAANGEEL